MKTFKNVKTIILSAFFILICTQVSGAAEKPDPVIIGLDADMTSGSAQSGEAIKRGIVLAMDELNRHGGVLGRPLRLLVRDHRGNPARGIDNIVEFAGMEGLVAVVGGLHTPVAMAELKTIHKHQIVYLVPWAAGTPVIENGFEPNYAFRVSVRDEYAGRFLIDSAIAMGHKQPGLLLEQTGWGRSNQRSMIEAMASHGIEPVSVQWFHWGNNDLRNQIKEISKAGADVVMLVANAPEGVAAVRSMAGFPDDQRLPIVSHWGITGGGFFRNAGENLSKVDLVFLQTFSFLDPPHPERAEQLFRAYKKSYPGTREPKDIISSVGTVHAYDLIHLLALAVQKAGVIKRPAVREALEHLEKHRGVMRDYDPAFTPENHDALNSQDYRIARYDENGAIVPVRTGR